MGRVARFFGNPGVRTDVHQQAPIPQRPHDQEILNKINEERAGHLVEVETDSSESSVKVGRLEVEDSGEITTSIGFTGMEKNRTDKILDWLVEAAGSQWCFILMWLIMIGWIVAGAVTSGAYDWQVVMQDGQSIQSYIWDTLLMRQQLMSAHEHMCICAELESRVSIIKKLLGKIISESDEKNDNANDHLPEFEVVTADLQDRTWYDKFSSFASQVVGSWYSIVIYWIGIFIWIGCGALTIDAGNSAPFTGRTTGNNPQYSKWGNMWQMYINTATAVQLFLCTVFLQNIRGRHDVFVAKFIKEIFVMDLKIDTLLRQHSGDYKTEADVVTLPAHKRSKGEYFIDWYGDIIGTGVGVLIAVCVFAAWLGVGHTMSWDDNWWLIIGTYTGLVGFFDGFVIRQNYFRIVKNEETNYERLIAEDYEIFNILGIECPEHLVHIPEAEGTQALTYKISVWVNTICSSQLSVLASLIFIIALLCIAGGMKFNETGQLLCNTPTMIIEGFFLLILLQAHNWADVTRRAEISLLYNRKIFLLAYLENRFGEKAVDYKLD